MIDDGATTIFVNIFMVLHKVLLRFKLNGCLTATQLRFYNVFLKKKDHIKKKTNLNKYFISDNILWFSMGG